MSATSQTNLAETSNTWCLVGTFAIFYFLYQWLNIYTVIALTCLPLERFWLAEAEVGLSPLEGCLLVFLLFGLWALVEIICAHINKLADRAFCTLVCVILILCVLAALATLRTQWEYHEVQRGEREQDNFTFDMIKAHENVRVDRRSGVWLEECRVPFGIR